MGICELLHKLPSELEQERLENVQRMRVYLAAKGQFMKRRQAEQQAMQELNQWGVM